MTRGLFNGTLHGMGADRLLPSRKAMQSAVLLSTAPSSVFPPACPALRAAGFG